MRVKYISQQRCTAPQSGIAPWIERMRLSNSAMRPSRLTVGSESTSCKIRLYQRTYSRGLFKHAIQLLTHSVPLHGFIHIRKI
jgi:hypothetical protein